MQTNLTSWRHFDFWLFGATLVLVIFGVTMIRSAVAGNIELTTETNLVNRQIIFAVISFVAMFITASIDYHYWSSISRVMYLVTVIALLVLNIIAPAVFGSARWFQVLTINIQPSEVAKIVIILVLAEFFTQHSGEVGDLHVVGRSLLTTLGIMVWILLQPNLSTSIVILVLWFALLWAGGLKVKHLLLFIGVGLVASAILIPIFIQLDIIKEYQIGRVTSFLFPDPNARYGDIYNIQQALISIGSGGWFGQGYGGGSQVQLRFLKVRWSDYIFSAMAQEFGFVGTVIVLAILAFVIYRCLRAARLARDTFGALIAYGVTTLIAFQALVNIGVNLKLLPATGLTLPFISYGGSSLLSALLGIGLVESVLIRQKALEF
jgi:rod shape determining protein RodA